MEIRKSLQRAVVLLLLCCSTFMLRAETIVTKDLVEYMLLDHTDGTYELWVKSCKVGGSVVIPEKIAVSIGGKAREIPVTQINSEAFKNVTHLKKLVAKSIEKIWSNAFEGCTALESVEFSDKLKEIDIEAFKNCTVLKSFVAGSGLRTIWSGAFYGCSALSDFKFNDGLLSIGDEAFRGTAIPYLRMPVSLAYVGSGAFRSSKLEWVEFNSTIKEVKDFCFAYCSKLNNVTWKNQITSIGEQAFRGCNLSGELVLPGAIAKVEKAAFYEQKGITSVYLKGATAVGDYAFTRCTELKYVKEARMLKTIGYAAFAGCISLKNVEWTDELKKIGNCAFRDAFEYSSINFPESLDISVGDSAFMNAKLTEVSFNSAGGTVGKRAFNGSTLSSLKFTPYKYTNISWTLDDNGFTGCKSLKSVYFGKGDFQIEYCVFLDCSKLSSVDFKDAEIVWIGNLAFGNCPSLTSIHLPSCVRKIKGHPFWNLSGVNYVPNSTLKEITLGEYGMNGNLGLTLEDTGGSNFCDDMKALERFIIWYQKPPFIAYSPTVNNTVLYVPAGTKEAYEKKFRYFKRIEEMHNGGVDAVTVDAVEITVAPDGSLSGLDGIDVEVYSISGQRIFIGDCTEARLPHKGIFILKIGNKSVKLAYN